MLTWSPGVRESVDSTLAAALERVIAPLTGDFTADEGARSSVRQARLHAAYVAGTGPRAAAPGTSAHEVRPALAVDLELRTASGWDWRYQDLAWRELVAAVKASPDLHSLDALGDTDHVELVHWWRTPAAIAQGIRPAGMAPVVLGG